MLSLDPQEVQDTVAINILVIAASIPVLGVPLYMIFLPTIDYIGNKIKGR